MTYTVRAYALEEINLAPETVLEDILQNVATIISTRKGTVPLDRNFGLSQDFLDRPMLVAEPLVTAEITEAISEYEPRAAVVSVEFEAGDSPGVLIPVVEVEINEQYLS